MILGDQGADVIKVEPLDGGDATRARRNGAAGFPASFLNNNRNKRSIALDLKAAGGASRAAAPCATADVFVQNFRPGVVERLGVDEAAVRAVAPEDRLCLDQRVWRERALRAKAGLRPDHPGLFGARDGAGRRRRCAPAHAAHDPPRQIDRDHRVAGDHRRAVGARAHRRGPACPAVDARSGAGVSLALRHGRPDLCRRRAGTQEKASATDLVYETNDGWITVAVQTNAQWVALTGRSAAGMARRRAFQDPGAAPEECRGAAGADAGGADDGRSAEQWLDRLTEAGVPCAPVLTRNQVIRAPQVEALGAVVETDHPKAGRLRQMRNAARFSGTPAEIRRGAPALGEHTRRNPRRSRLFGRRDRRAQRPTA